MIIVSLRVVQLAWELRSSMLHASFRSLRGCSVYVIAAAVHYRSRRHRRHPHHRHSAGYSSRPLATSLLLIESEIGTDLFANVIISYYKRHFEQNC